MPEKPNTTGTPIARVLADDPILAGWQRRRRDEARLTEVLRGELPRPLAPHVAAWIPAPEQLELVATTGAVAAALRLRLPAVRSALEREGWNFRDIRVRVQPGAPRQAAVKPVIRQWDSAQAPALRALADQLPDGPLKSAVAGWLERARR